MLGLKLIIWTRTPERFFVVKVRNFWKFQKYSNFSFNIMKTFNQMYQTKKRITGQYLALPILLSAKAFPSTKKQKTFLKLYLFRSVLTDSDHCITEIQWLQEELNFPPLLLCLMFRKCTFLFYGQRTEFTTE